MGASDGMSPFVAARNAFDERRWVLDELSSYAHANLPPRRWIGPQP